MKAQTLKNELKRLGYGFFTGVPCSLLQKIIKELGDEYIPSVREDTALGIAAGAYLGGKKACVLMQNSGLGYSLNVLSSLNLIYDIPVLLIVSYRGFEGRDAPEHIVMGRHCVELTGTFGIASRVCGKDELALALEESQEHISGGRPFCVFVKEGAIE